MQRSHHTGTSGVARLQGPRRHSGEDLRHTLRTGQHGYTEGLPHAGPYGHGAFVRHGQGWAICSAMVGDGIAPASLEVGQELVENERGWLTLVVAAPLLPELVQAAPQWLPESACVQRKEGGFNARLSKFARSLMSCAYSHSLLLGR